MTPIAIKKLIVNKNMKHYNFDEVIERHGTSCVKFDRLKEMFGNENLIPLWVADMDFRTPDFIVEALKKRCEHEIFGYTFGSDEYYESIINWVHYKHNWKIQREWISYIPGIVKGIAFAIQCFTQKGDKVIIQPPVYHPFRIVPEKMKREVVYNPLKMVDGVYEMDFDHLESIIDDKCKVLILCNPHNPGGIVWKKETLVRLAEICAKHNILVISDEIHAEMAYPQYTHYPFASVSDTAASCSITFMAPSKTFNLASMMMSNIFIANPELRAKFRKQLDAAGTSQLGVMGLVACETAYNKGEEWYEAMLSYVKANAEFTKQYVEEQLPGVKMIDLEGTYLVWLDFRKTGLSVDELEDLMINKAKLWLDSGKIFGDSGRGFQRINIACPRATLTEALERIRDAMKSR